MKYVIGISTILWVIAGCKLPEPIPFITLDEEMKAYFAAADSGAVYIYKDSASGIIDTIRVIKRSGRNYNNYSYLNEGFTLRYAAQQTDNFWTDVTTTRNDSPRYHFSINYQSGRGRYIWKEDGEYFPTGHVTILDQVEVEGVVYKDVLKIEDFYAYYNRYYFAKGVGRILLESKSSTSKIHVWKLIEYIPAQ